MTFAGLMSSDAVTGLCARIDWGLSLTLSSGRSRRVDPEPGLTLTQFPPVSTQVHHHCHQ